MLYVVLLSTITYSQKFGARRKTLANVWEKHKSYVRDHKALYDANYKGTFFAVGMCVCACLCVRPSGY